MNHNLERSSEAQATACAVNVCVPFNPAQLSLSFQF